MAICRVLFRRAVCRGLALGMVGIWLWLFILGSPFAASPGSHQDRATAARNARSYRELPTITFQQITSKASPKVIDRSSDITVQGAPLRGSGSPRNVPVPTRRTNVRGSLVNGSSPLRWPLQMRSDARRTKHTWPWGSLAQCNNKSYGAVGDLPVTSIIICFGEHENVADVLHTVHSVLQRTPEALLGEILLIDDSTHDNFQGILNNYLAGVIQVDKVRVIRGPSTSRSLGVIQARLLGARLAREEVLVSLDAHMEVQPGWLEPLLWEIRQDNRTLASSFLDWMEKDDQGTWAYRHGASNWKTYFDWHFVFGFQVLSGRDMERRKPDPTEPVRSPVTVGTLFAIDRRFFEDIGSFDGAMEGWGGENLDLPLRVWMFGGRVVNVPCSHAAHLERQGARSYRNSWDQLIKRNYKRVAEVWLDEYKHYYYYYNPEVKDIDAGDLSLRLELKQRRVHDFSWFLSNVFPELGLYNKNSLAWGGLKNEAVGLCLHVSPPAALTLRTCNGDAKYQGLFWSNKGELRFPVHVFNAKQDGLVMEEYVSHYASDTASKWIHWRGGPVKHHTRDQCLGVRSRYWLTLGPCNATEPTQRWTFGSYSEQYTAALEDADAGMEYATQDAGHVNATRDAGHVKATRAAGHVKTTRDAGQVNATFSPYYKALLEGIRARTHTAAGS